MDSRKYGNVNHDFNFLEFLSVRPRTSSGLIARRLGGPSAISNLVLSMEPE